MEHALHFNSLESRKKTSHLYCFLSIIFMVQVVITVCTVAVIAEFTICKAITVPEMEDTESISKHNHYLGVVPMAAPDISSLVTHTHTPTNKGLGHLVPSSIRTVVQASLPGLNLPVQVNFTN